jgi:hypothetical protein
MPRDGFPAGVAEQLKWYVYRLIDPRNGETFYVGKGQGNRIFAHAKGEFTDTAKSDVEEREDATDLKMQRIKEILAGGGSRANERIQWIGTITLENGCLSDTAVRVRPTWSGTATRK